MDNKIDAGMIISKKHPTGYEVGLLLFASALHQQEQSQKGEQRTDLYTQKEFTKVENRLTQQERINYEPYRLLYNSILDTFANLLSKFTLFSSSFYCIFFRVHQLFAETNEKLNLCTTPLIVTESEYNQLYQQTIERMEQEGRTTKPTKEDIALTIRGKQGDITPESYYRHFRAIAGIAVIKDPFNSVIDDKNNYKDKEKSFVMQNLYEELEEDKSIIRDQYNNIKDVISTLYAYSSLLGIIEKFYNIPTLQERLDARKTRKVCERTMDILQAEIRKLNTAATNGFYSSSEQEKNLRAINEVFPAFNLKALQPTAKQIRTATKVIEEINTDPEKIKLYKDLTPFIERLKPATEQ